MPDPPKVIPFNRQAIAVDPPQYFATEDSDEEMMTAAGFIDSHPRSKD